MKTNNWPERYFSKRNKLHGVTNIWYLIADFQTDCNKKWNVKEIIKNENKNSKKKIIKIKKLMKKKYK